MLEVLMPEVDGIELCRRIRAAHPTAFLLLSAPPASPSCGARRMAELAAHLVDRVLPDVPIRQWVVTPPAELRLPILSDPSFLGAFIRISVTSVFHHLTASARRRGVEGGQSGAVTFVQAGGKDYCVQLGRTESPQGPHRISRVEHEGRLDSSF